MCDIIYQLSAKPTTAQTNDVQSRISHRFTTCYHKWGYILAGSRTTLHHHISANATELVHQHNSRDDSIVINNHFACQFGGIAHNDAITKHAVVSDVSIFHDEVVAAHDGFTLAGCSAMDGHILPNLIVVTYFHRRFFALEFQVLRHSSNHCTREQRVSISHPCARKQCHTVHQHIVITYGHILVDETERTNLTIITNLCFRVDKS